jgi:hypothetical protein
LTDQGGHDPLHRQPGHRAARDIDDPNRLLHGEDPETTYLDDARHWLFVYEELLGFKHDIIQMTRRRAEELSDGAKEELMGTDIPILEAEERRLAARFEFWHGRVAELER